MAFLASSSLRLAAELMANQLKKTISKNIYQFLFLYTTYDLSLLNVKSLKILKGYN